MPLVMAPHGVNMQIVRLSAEPKLCRHLESLGIVSGAQITLISDVNGSIIIRIHDSRLALDKKLARSIMVKVTGN